MFWTGVALAVALITVWLVPAGRGASRRSDQLEVALDQLLKCELEQAFLSIRPKFAATKFLQFGRYPIGDSRLGIELAFPSAAWSDDYFPKIVTAASQRGLKYEVQELKGEVNRFVFVQFEDSAYQAAAFAQSVLTDVFGFAPDYNFRVRIN
ncbi:MAG: hypothetical protein DRR11_16695 [Gammaproteobacteria bacterium]|nr:MAG: hypothetical protein DRR11_16695 [Gammaproteobacteria bacterium]